MTRRGSLAYYFVAVAVGSFFFAATYTIHQGIAEGFGELRQAGRNFLFVYFLAVIQGILPQIFSAFFLRRLAVRFGWERAWQWMLMGTVSTLAVVWGLAQMGLAVERTYFSREWQNVKNWLVLSVAGPIMVATGMPFWFPIPAAVATAYLLYTVHRRFAEAREEQTASGAG